jgi:hypothetical protein
VAKNVFAFHRYVEEKATDTRASAKTRWKCRNLTWHLIKQSGLPIDLAEAAIDRENSESLICRLGSSDNAMS